ncbi:MAG: hypothetical protein ACHQO8_05230 [Vicinamibacterales bacterium]
MSRRASIDLTVLKLGGSVLTDRKAYRAAAAFLAARAVASGARLLVVVSAELGHTDALLAEAQSFSADPDTEALDLLWSTGELRSVALLTLALKAAGVDAAGFNAHATGLRAGRNTVALNPLALRAAIVRHAVVVVPGFLATERQRLVTLGRGGSDFSAVILAVALGADRLELIKDVDGYFTADPRASPAAELIPHLHVDDALRLAEGGCPLVQRRAVAAARDARLPLVVRSLTSQGTTVEVAAY